MSDLEWFAFVFLPIGVTVFGAVMAGAGVWLINRADRPQVMNRETRNRKSASETFGPSYTFTTTFSPMTGWAMRERERDLFDDETGWRAH